MAAALLSAAGLTPTVAHAVGPAALGSGTVYAWGDNTFGELGDGTTTDHPLPIRVPLPAGVRVVAVAAGFGYSLGLTSTGRVLAWGLNFFGELGDGTAADQHRPVWVHLPAGVRVVAVAAGFEHVLVLTSTGQVFGWGRNSYGQVGDDTTLDRYLPVRVQLPAGVRVVSIAAGSGDSAAITSDGRELAWGYNYTGALGNGSRRQRHTPVWVDLPPDRPVLNTSVGQGGMYATTTRHTALAWGYNYNGELGNGSRRSSSRPVPVAIPAGVSVRAVTAGYAQGYALTGTGSILAWGFNGLGDLGDGTTIDRYRPVPVHLPPGTAVTAVTASEATAAALTTTGRLLAWGDNADGDLGDGTHDERNLPIEVHLPADAYITEMSTGPDHMLAVTRP